MARQLKDAKIQGRPPSPTHDAGRQPRGPRRRPSCFVLKGDYGYKPEGVKLGDADKVLFWYKPKGKETYRALFGDLHAADVTADQLPAAEKPQPKP